jgi:hypothetical protein
MDSLQHTANQVCVPGRSAVLTMEATPWRVPTVDDQASAEGFMGAANSMGAGVEGSSAVPTLERPDKLTGRKQSCTVTTEGSQ